jgi:hypothetical protein
MMLLVGNFQRKNSKGAVTQSGNNILIQQWAGIMLLKTEG